MSGKSYVVGARVGRWIIGWPFARLDITRDRLILRFWPFSASGPYSVPGDSVRRIHIRRRLYRILLTIEDSADTFRDISIELPHRVEEIIRELNSQGYFINDER